MTDVRELKPGKPRKIGETIFTESGSRLAPKRKVTDSGWFLPLLLTLPFGAFVLVLLW